MPTTRDGLTPEWCEEEARAWEHDDPGSRIAAALRLAARALRAREWCERVSAKDSASAFHEGGAIVAAQVLAILNGETP